MRTSLEVLRWGGTRHSLRLFRAGLNTRATLMIRKDGGNQTIDVDLKSVTVGELYRAWIRQDSKWVDLYVKDGDPFEAVRVIKIADGTYLVWYVFHEHNAPADLCTLWQNATEEAIVMAYIDPA